MWVNEEDQMRIVSMEKGDNIKGIITRFSLGTSQIQKVLKENDADFMHSEHLGWILTCPSNLGTGLRAGCMVKIPLFSARADFKVSRFLIDCFIFKNNATWHLIPCNRNVFFEC